jgi:predicted DCC family thiol-disulfide oxidoreductase YuxK
MADAPVVLFDGTCNLCDGVVHFVIDHERGSSLMFAALQSDAGKALLERAGSPDLARHLLAGATGEGDPDSIALVEDGRVYTYSAAALRLTRHMRWPWSWLSVFLVVPPFIRDAVYRWVARHRYRWFGKTESCRVPTPELRARFLA